jgi:transposase
MPNHAAKAVRSGKAVESVADACDVNIRTLFCWLAAYARGGQKALQSESTPGLPSTLTAEQISWLAGAVRSHTTQQYQFDFALRSPALVNGLIERRFGLSLSRSTFRRVMRSVSLSHQRQLYGSMQRDTVLAERWHREEPPTIAAEAKGAGDTVLFADEESKGSLPYRRRLGAPSRAARGGGYRAMLLARHALGGQRSRSVRCCGPRQESRGEDLPGLSRTFRSTPSVPCFSFATRIGSARPKW